LDFVGLGAVLGLIGPLFAALEKVGGAVPSPLTKGDVATVAAFFFCAALTIVCLVLAGINWWRNSGLADEIRKRPKHASFSTRETA
jgi:hypothetical protein